MVVIAGLIGGQGLGDVVTSGGDSNPALAILAGVAIVIMAIALDRATEAMANRTDPTRRHLTERGKKRLHLFTLACAAAVGLAVGLGHWLGAASVWSRWTAQPWLLRHVQSILDYVQNPGTFVFHITNPVGLPRQVRARAAAKLLRRDAVAGDDVRARADRVFISGLRPAVVTAVMLTIIGVSNEWTQAMDTLSQVLVATVLTMLVGIPLGVWAAESRRAQKVMRPILDVLQTLPQLVYIIPFIYLMPVSIVPGIIAGVSTRRPSSSGSSTPACARSRHTRSRPPARSARHACKRSSR